MRPYKLAIKQQYFLITLMYYFLFLLELGEEGAKQNNVITVICLMDAIYFKGINLI